LWVYEQNKGYHLCVCGCACAHAWVLSKGRGVRLFQTSGRHKKLDSWSTTNSSLSHFECKISEASDASPVFSSVRSTVRKHIIISSFKNVLSFISYFLFPALLFSFIHLYILSLIHSRFLSFLRSFPTLIKLFYFFIIYILLLCSFIFMLPSLCNCVVIFASFYTAISSFCFSVFSFVQAVEVYIFTYWFSMTFQNLI